MRFTSIRQLLELTGINAKAAACLGKSGALSNLDDGLNEIEAEEYASGMVGYLRSLKAYEEKLEAAAVDLDVPVDNVERVFEEAQAKRTRDWEAEVARRTELNKQKEADGKKLLKIPPPPAKLRVPKKPEEITPPRKSFSQRERVSLQREALNLYLTGHPLDEVPPDDQITDIRSVEELEKDEGCVIRGVLLSYKVSTTRKKKVMARLRLEDKTGSIEVVAFPNLYETLQGALHEGELYRVHGQVDKVVNVDREGVEQAHVQFKASRVSVLKVGSDKEWDLSYPLLKGSMRILPGRDKLKSRASGIVLSFARRK